MGMLYRVEELRRLEERAAASLPSGALMQRAGQSAAEWIHAWLAGGAGSAGVGAAQGPVLVLCGPGNNGGDGYSCAGALQRLGRGCLCWAPRAGKRADALAARARWQRDGGTIVEELPQAAGIALVVDAIFGIGMERALDEPYLGALRWAHSHALPLLALDLPSGLDADTGAWVGGVAGVPAQHTITFLGDKPGLHTLEGIDASGAVTLADLGVAEAPGGAIGRLNEPALFPLCLRPRPANSNKGDFGTVSICGGAAGMVGAALLAARSALRLGAGKVFADFLGAPGLAFDPLQPELMLRPGALPPGVDVLVAGCGLGTEAAAHARLEHALAHDGALVLDADALNLLAADAQLRLALGARARCSTVLTPHPGEAARLAGLSTRAVQENRVRAALDLAQRLACIVVLKGAGSVIAVPAGDAGRYFVNPTGGPALASPGTGDVLAGMIGALAAQAPSGADADSRAQALLQAVLAAVWLHGQAAADFGAQSGLTASEIAPLAARALARLRAGSGTPTALAGR